MKKERAMELLNSVINYVSCANNTPTTIQELLQMGFTEEELVAEFSFSEDDVREAAADNPIYE